MIFEDYTKIKENKKENKKIKKISENFMAIKRDNIEIFYEIAKKYGFCKKN
jgi:hypothetical protein